MADVTMVGADPLLLLSQQHADIRADVHTVGADTRADVREVAANIRQEVAKTGSDGIDATKSSGWAVSDRVGTEADRVVAQDTAYFIAGQNINFQNSTALAALKAGVDASFAKTQADISLAAERNAAATALASGNTNLRIVEDGNATRALINDLRNQDLNRMLLERNAEIIEQRGKYDCCHNGLVNSQSNAVLQAVNAFQSQLQETRQGMVNLGTMVGVGQTSTPTNIR